MFYVQTQSFSLGNVSNEVVVLKQIPCESAVLHVAVCNSCGEWTVFRLCKYLWKRNCWKNIFRRTSEILHL